MIKKSACCSALLIAALAGVIIDVRAQDNDFGNSSLPASCEYTTCSEEGLCIHEGGVEYCSCGDTHFGLFCEIPIDECTDTSCDNGGQCIDLGLNGRYCDCLEGFSGARCENIDNSSFCPDIEEGDYKFLPKCSLKKSLGLLATCINDQLPYINHFSPPDFTACSAKVWRTVQCIYLSVASCSGMSCASVYDHGGLQVYESIAANLYNPESPFMQQVFKLLCAPPMPGVGFPSLNETFGIGSPVCSNDTVDQLIKALIEYENRTYHIHGGINKCSELDNLRMKMYEIAKDSCEWDRMYEALMSFTNVTDPQYWSHILQAAHEEFLNWRVPSCKGDDPSPNMCYYTSCGNGSCTSYNGTEICNCMGTGYTGMFCEVPVGNCATQNPCHHGGSCFEADGGMYCSCPPGSSGTYCEIDDGSTLCPVIEQGDLLFLPRCSLKQSLDRFATCINNQLPYLDPFSPDSYTCSGKVWSTVQCIYKSVTSCSGLTCESAFEYGGLEIYERIANELYNPLSPFMQVVYTLLCTPPMYFTEHVNMNETFNIGSPVCTSDILDHLVAALIEGSIRASSPDANLCSELGDMRMKLFQIANDSCDWDKVYDALSNMNISIRPHSPANYWSDVLQIAHQEFLNWTVPGCEVRHCPDNYCQKGDCSVLLDESFFCTCRDMYSGDRCEKYDETALCPVPDANDVEFFPKCTLRQTVDKTMQCLSGLPSQLFGQVDYYQCSMAYYNAVECLRHMVGNCSNLNCKSIYYLPGAPEAVQAIFMMLYNSDISGGLSGALCSSYGGQILLEYVRNAFHGMNNTVDNAIGLICPGQSLRNVTAGLEWIVEMIGRSGDMRETCSIIDTARQHAYETLMSSCNLQVLDFIGQYTDHGELLSYVSKGISIVISMLHDYTLPMCQGIDGGPDPDDIYCPSLSYSSCQSEMFDAYMCSIFKYKKLLSRWIEQIMQWGRYRTSFMERNWKEFASMMGFYHSYDTAMGEHGFLGMLRANIDCGHTSYMHCDGAHQFDDVLGCRHCYRPGGSRGHGASMLMEWTMLYKQAVFFQKIYEALKKDMGGCGGGIDPSMPPFTDFSTWFSTSTYSPGTAGNSGSPPVNPGTLPPWMQTPSSNNFQPGDGTTRPFFHGSEASTSAPVSQGSPQQTAGSPQPPPADRPTPPPFV